MQLLALGAVKQRGMTAEVQKCREKERERERERARGDQEEETACLPSTKLTTASRGFAAERNRGKCRERQIRRNRTEQNRTEQNRTEPIYSGLKLGQGFQGAKSPQL